MELNDALSFNLPVEPGKLAEALSNLEPEQRPEYEGAEILADLVSLTPPIPPPIAI